jgi:molybdate-binding protein
MEKVNYTSRKFLNPKQGMAAIECSVASGAYSSSAVDATITVSDCSRQAQLDFGVYSKADAKARIAKLNLLGDELRKFKEQLENAIAQAEFKQ